MKTINIEWLKFEFYKCIFLNAKNDLSRLECFSIFEAKQAASDAIYEDGLTQIVLHYKVYAGDRWEGFSAKTHIHNISNLEIDLIQEYFKEIIKQSPFFMRGMPHRSPDEPTIKFINSPT